jgi:glycine betaine/proline transport system ATP-binding protein
VEPTSGKVYIEDRDVANMDKKDLMMLRRNKIGMVFQGFGLLPFRTVFANAKLGLEISGMDADEIEDKVMRALEMVGLKEWKDSYPDELSGGMQQRVGTARAIATGQEILLMDEPFSALDPLIRRESQDELLALQKKVKKTIIFVTHDLLEAIKVGDRIAVMNDQGKIIQVGAAWDIVEHPADDYVRDFTQDMVRFLAVEKEKTMGKEKIEESKGE